jgi:hypothetical protein
MESTTPHTRKALTLLVAAVVALSATAGFAGFAAAATTTDLTVSISDDDGTIAPGETTTVEIAVTNADGGVGAASYGIELSDPSVAEITDADIGGATTAPAIQQDGSSADIRYFQGDTDDSGEVVILTVTLEATAAGTTSLDVVENSDQNNLVVFDEVGAGYTLDSIGSATLTVNTPPSADAGGDQTVDQGATVTLDASASNDPDGDTLSYQWSQTGDGPSVSLSDASAAQPTFTAPDVSEETTLDFEVEVSDGTATDTDSVSVTVQPPAPDPAVFAVSNLQAPGSATQGDTIDVSADVENTGGQAATKAVEFRVDTDGDGSIADENAVASQDVQLDAGGSTTVTFEDVDTSGLPAGTLTHGVFTVDDTATAQITIDAPAEANFQVSNLQAPGSATQGDTITVSADVENTGDQEATQTVEFRIDDSSDDLDDGDDDAVISQEVTLAAGASETVTFDVDTSALVPGDYVHGVVTEDDSGTAQITIEEPAPTGDKETTVSLQPAEQIGAVGTTTTYEVVVDDAQGGVGAAEIAVGVDDPSVAEIAGVEILNANSEDVTITPSSASFDYFGADTDQTGSVVVAEVTVEGAGAGTTDLSVEPADGNSEVLVFDEEGQPYDVTGTDGATLEVEPVSFLVDDTSAPEKAGVGSTVTITTTISSDGEVESTQLVGLNFDVDGDGDDQSDETQNKEVTIGPNGQTQVSFEVEIPADASFGDREYDIVTSAEVESGTVEVTPPDVNGDGELPGDLNDDGIYEDVNGDGTVNTGDPQALFGNRDTDAVEKNAAAFDFNGDGVVNVGDAQALFIEVTGSA